MFHIRTSILHCIVFRACSCPYSHLDNSCRVFVQVLVPYGVKSSSYELYVVISKFVLSFEKKYSTCGSYSDNSWITLSTTFVRRVFQSLAFHLIFCIQNTVFPAVIMEQLEKREIMEQLEKQLKLVGWDSVCNAQLLNLVLLNTSDYFHSVRSGWSQPSQLSLLALGEFETAALALT